MPKLPDAETIANAVHDAGCITTNRLAATLGCTDRDYLRAACLRLVLAGDLVLASYGWDYSYAWTTPELAEDMDLGGRRNDRPGGDVEPWFMDRLSRYAIMREAAELPDPEGDDPHNFTFAV